MFKIRFQGFMTHALVDGRWVVVFYNEPVHELRLTVYDSDWIPEETTLSPIGTGPGISCFDIHGHMHLDGVETGPIQPNLAGVPHLTTIASHNVVLRLGQDYITLKPYAEVRITNMDTLEPTPDEYQFYKTFFRNVSTLQQLAATSILCPYGSGETTPVRCGEGGTLGVECSN